MAVLIEVVVKGFIYFFFLLAATMELYEGKTQTNSTAWSSLDPPPLPMVERQSYIIPGSVVALKETITEKGITNKDILSEWIAIAVA